MKKTYDVHFNDDLNSNNKGFKETAEYCRTYVMVGIGNKHKIGYFKDYIGGTSSVVCNETGETYYSKEIK